MLSELKILKLSEKVKEYIKNVEEETGYIVSIKDFKGRGAIVTLDNENKYIRVEINEEESKNESEEEIDYILAHEVTHEFLSLTQGYCRIRADSKTNEKILFLVSAIEDIVVDSIIQENNFSSNHDFYLNEIRISNKGIRKHAHKNRNYFDADKGDIKFIHLVADYILAWNYFKYSKPDKIDKKALHKFLKTIQKFCPKQYEEAEKITSIITKNGIFTSEGYNKTIMECLKLLNLIDLVEVYQII